MTNKILLLNNDEMLLFCDIMQQAYNNKSKQDQRQENKHENNKGALNNEK